jgi:hypothetical protein
MAGPNQFAVYHADDGNAYKVAMPLWEFNLNTGGAGATTQPAYPRGWQRRKRALRYNSTGREEQITVLSVSDTIWTGAIGTAIAAPQSPDFGTTPGSPNATLQGAMGERRLTRA